MLDIGHTEKWTKTGHKSTAKDAINSPKKHNEPNMEIENSYVQKNHT